MKIVRSPETRECWTRNRETISSFATSNNAFRIEQKWKNLIKSSFNIPEFLHVDSFNQNKSLYQTFKKLKFKMLCRLGNSCPTRIEHKGMWPLSVFVQFCWIQDSILSQRKSNKDHSICRGKPPGDERLFSFKVCTLVSLNDSQHLPQLNFTDTVLWTLTKWPFSVEENDNQSFEVAKCKGETGTLFKFLLEDQGNPIHVLLYNEVTSKRHALSRSVHKLDPLTG